MELALDHFKDLSKVLWVVLKIQVVYIDDE
jgi:hypothetical protein